MIEAGNRYQYEGGSVIAFGPARRGQVRVRRIDPRVPVIGMGAAFWVEAKRLTQEPMRYFSNQLPGGGE